MSDLRVNRDLAVLYCGVIPSRGDVMRLPIALLAFALASPTSAQDGDSAWLEMAARAVQQSKLTLPGSMPFHLRAEIVEKTNPASEYQAKVEEYWVSPEKWKRTIESPAFSQTMIINGDKFLEKDTGDYFPWWLNDLVSAMFDPLPTLVMPNQVNSQTRKTMDPRISSFCTGVQTTTDRWNFCFDPRHVLLTSVVSISTGYAAEFNDFRDFGEKKVPRQIVSHPESGMTIQATIRQLVELRQPDEELFTIGQSTPPEDRITRMRIDQDTLRKLSLTSTDIDWPAVGGGPATGGCAVYVSADRAGRMREVWPGGCDNAGLEDPLRDMVKKWQLKTATANGVPVQVESRLTFAFKTQVNPNPLPELSDSEARKLATNVVEPVFPPQSGAVGSEIVVQISVDETGKLTGVQNTHNLKDPTFLAAYRALGRWHFMPYMQDGKPQYFHADITFLIH
jgi:hypothetical protein